MFQDETAVGAQAGLTLPRLCSFKLRQGLQDARPPMDLAYLPPALLGSGAVSIGIASVASGSTRGL